MKIISRILVLAVLSLTSAGGQNVSRSAAEEGTMFADNELIAKGGIGVIVGETLYVDLKSKNNELRLSGGNRWSGQSVPVTELVIFFDHRVWSPQNVPPGFDLSRAVIVCFEGNKVRFFNFGSLRGGYYKRPKSD